MSATDPMEYLRSVDNCLDPPSKSVKKQKKRRRNVPYTWPVQLSVLFKVPLNYKITLNGEILIFVYMTQLCIVGMVVKRERYILIIEIYSSKFWNMENLEVKRYSD